MPWGAINNREGEQNLSQRSVLLVIMFSSIGLDEFSSDDAAERL